MNSSLKGRKDKYAMTKEREEVFRGYLIECLEHYRDALAQKMVPGSKGSSVLKKPMAQFCGVGVASVARWFSKPEKLPVGEPLIKLMFFLDSIGYSVIELGKMGETQRNFAGLIGFGILSSKRATKLLDYKETSTLYQVLHGHQGSSPARDRKMWDFWKEKRKELEERKASFRALHGEQTQPTVQPDRASARRGSRPTTSQASAPRESGYEVAMSVVTVHLMQALLIALTEESPFSRLSPSELVALRQSENGRTIINLSAKLSALSARLMTTSESNGGN
ncbi:MAG: hypothetical protein CMI58_04240 [Parcubacteria group bacterium]|jgi:hypothetical protein|nr:hypothetical protein [Parcubacteria group bacterium]|tara:strand:- start:507 stop:1343 length:837 start_codon:yes stop_codon:yes gene_type:complete